ncbi:MAG TPA: hypothetical protein VJ872_14645 [Nocardioides sp.]|nr:hypothetical protein [Nocardioides sp.]
MTWTLLFIGMVVAILSIFVTFVMVLVRASSATPPPRPTLVGHTGDGEATPVAQHHHPHAA